MVTAAACGSATAPSPSLTGTVTDPAGDTTPPAALLVAPDLVAATLDVSGGNLTATVTFAPGTLSPTLTLTSILLDTDENPATGSPGVDSDGTDAALIGVDYIIDAVRPLGSGVALVLGSTGTPNQFVGVGAQFLGTGTIPVSFPTADQMRLTVPLSMVGNGDGRMTFKVVVRAYLSANQTTAITDYMPNVGLPPGVVQ